jgi:hypothetical protein
MKKKENDFTGAIDLKNVADLKKLFSETKNAFVNGTIWPTQDGNFMFINGNFVRLDHTFRKIVEKLIIPECGFEPITDKAILWKIPRHSQYSPQGFLVPNQYKVSSGNGTQKIDKQRERFFIVKPGKNFSKMTTGTDDPLVLGDEVILADYVDGLAELPTVQDPTGYILHEFISLHYTEIQGYVRHTEVKGKKKEDSKE